MSDAPPPGTESTESPDASAFETPLTSGTLARQLRLRLERCAVAGWKVPLAPARRAPPAAPGPGRSPPPADRSAREAQLDAIRADVLACRACGLCQERTQPVFGAGDPCALLMFVGEAPGGDEDRCGIPFVGKAGQLLSDIIRAMRVRREDVYIANIIKCRPTGNRNPDPGEIGTCLPYLQRQIDVIRPLVICALGGVAARALLGRDQASVGSLRGRFHSVGETAVRVTYHPAYLLRNPADKRKTWEDVQTIMQRLGL